MISCYVKIRTLAVSSCAHADAMSTLQQSFCPSLISGRVQKIEFKPFVRTAAVATDFAAEYRWGG